MKRPKVIAAICLLIVTVGCTDSPTTTGGHTPLSEGEMVRFQTVVDTLLKACNRNDSSACDTLIGILENPRLAHSNPALIADGFYSYVASHAPSAPAPLARMEAFAQRTNSAYLQNWVLLLRGINAVDLMRLDTALSLLTKALPGFIEMDDTLGILTCTHSMGTLYLYRLDQPREFLQCWRVRERFTIDTLDRFNNAAHKGTAYRNLGLMDSARSQLDIMERLRPTVEEHQPGNLTNRVFHDDLRFTILCTEASRTRGVNMETLRKLFEEEVSLVEGGYLANGWNPITVRIDYANALIANGREREAEKVLKDGEHILSNCVRCKYHAIEFYGMIAGRLKGRNDLAGAFHYQELQMKAKQDLDMQARRAQAAHALITLRSAHQRDSLMLVNQGEQMAANAAVASSRSQRNTLLIASLLALIIAVLLLNRYRLKHRLNEERLRARLSRDLHDDIGSTLSSISILSNVARKKAEVVGDMDAAASLDKISDRSQRLMRNMSDIVWSVDPNKDTLEDLFSRMREFATSVLEGATIAYTIDFPKEVPAISLTAETKNNLYLIFKEAINNAVKHAQAERVEVLIALEKSALRMEVKDNGRGLDPLSPTNGHGGNGLPNMKARAAELKADLSVESAPHKGTVLLLTCSLER